jgi:hypothetical protein
MPRRLSPRTTLDHLKKEAKRWLKALRENVAEARARLERALPGAPDAPTLRDVQHALAREHGLPGWTALKDQLSRTPPDAPTLAGYERMAANLLEAYRTGTPDAMQRHWNDTWHRRSWEAMRTYVQLDLGKRPAAEGEDVAISLDDARFLVARDHGFASWQALVDYLAKLPPGGRDIAAAPVRPFAPDADGMPVESEGTRDWDEAITLLRERRLAGLAANGQMTDDVLERVSRLEHVTALRLGGSKRLTDAGVRHLARMPGLRTLDLSGTQVTDRGLAILRELPALESLSLAWTGVTDTGLVHLSHCERLVRVDLSATRTGDGAIAALAGMPALRHFRSGELVTDAGLPLLHRFPVFKTWHGGDVELQLTSPEAEPNSLLLRGSFTDRGLAALAGLDGLFALNLGHSRLAITAAGLAHLVTLPNLGMLAFDATDEAMPVIAAMPSLRFLMCQDTVAGDDGFAALSRSKSIEYIWGRRCYNLRSRGFTALAEMPALRGLSVSCRNVDDAALAALPGFPALRELMPMDVPDDGYRHIGRCEHLERLVLMYCRETTDAATGHLTGLRNLRKYFASYTRITDRTPELLSEVSSLEDVGFSSCAGLTDRGIAALARLPRLRLLDLGGMRQVTAEVLTAFPAQVVVRLSP